MDFKTWLNFRGTWRTYQKRVLDQANIYLKDNRIHIVAAPGSGKTTLGIELIRRLNRPALVLAPTITIREQWVERIQTGFMQDGMPAEEYISQNIRNPKLITIITYQALHSAMTGYQGKLTQEDEDSESLRADGEAIPEEEVDFRGFDLIQTLHAANIGVLCLDECHHLRNEWWKALEQLVQDNPNLQIISLTATPPYDSTPAGWERYIKLCGPIDEEITVPELVKEGSLCPHQDFVYFNYPTSEEKQVVNEFKENAAKALEKLLNDTEFAQIVSNHKFLKTKEGAAEYFLENPSYLTCILIYLDYMKIPYDPYYKRLLGTSKLPRINEKWMECLLQAFLYEHTEEFMCSKEYVKKMEDYLKHEGLVQKRKVSLLSNEKIEKMLINSKGKIESIKQIVATEYQEMGNNLRMLILTDYIKKEYIKAIGNEEMNTEALGVVPLFEMLRRQQFKGMHLAVLCGTIVILPVLCKEEILKIVDQDKIKFNEFGISGLEDYMQVSAIGDSHFLTSAVTSLFTDGAIHVLIGTKSLLGEGWDAPCINSLILASFVGSFMLSNQMRGRAIRVFKNHPEKTSNVWHLVCVKEQPKLALSEEALEALYQPDEDFTLLMRRMDNFIGLSYDEETIESGIERIGIHQSRFTRHDVEQINQRMCEEAGKRSTLKERWQSALAIGNDIEVTKETELTPKESGMGLCLFNAIALAFASCMIMVFFGVYVAYSFTKTNLNLFSVVMSLAVDAVAIVFFLVGIKRVSAVSTPLRRLNSVGNGIYRALRRTGMLSGIGAKVMTAHDGVYYQIFLKGGTGRDKELFINCVTQFYDVIDNQRYLLVNPRRKRSASSYYAIPDVFSKNKEDAVLFASYLKPYIGSYEPVYTRTADGRKLLLAGRIYALSNRQQRCLTKKKVKKAYE